MTFDLATPVPRVRILSDFADAQLRQLADVLIDCVEGGASVSFMLPLTPERALAFWQRVAEGVSRGERALLVAEDAQGIVGTVQLVLDTSGAEAERLYGRLGWTRLGVIPGFALLPDGGLCDTTYFYRSLA
jgi:hypothetical protein